MLENCLQDFSVELDFNKIPCCIDHLLIMDKMSEEYLLSYEFGKFLLKALKSIFEKEKTLIKYNTKLSENIYKELILMISKYMSHFYFTNKLKCAKYICKIIFNLYNSQDYYNNKPKQKDINSFKNNLCCIYLKEKRNDKAYNIIKDIYDSNNTINNNDTLIYLNNYINLYIKSKNKINKIFSNKINLLKTLIKQKIYQISQMARIYENNISNKKIIQNNYNINEIQLYLFIFYNYCNIHTKINNTSSQNFSYYKKGYELSIYYFGENHHLTLKYKNVINKSLFNINNGKNIYKYRNYKENHKTCLSKSEINYKLDEINNRLEKIGKSISPVKKIISNYKNEEKRYPNNLIKNKSKIQVNVEDIFREEEYNNENYFENNFIKNKINNKNYSYHNIEKKNIRKQKNEDIPKLVINLNNDNNDNLECTTLYQVASDYDYEENKQDEIKKNLPKFVINLDSHNNDNLECVTLFQSATDEKNNENKNNLPKLIINLDNHNNDNLECVTLFQSAEDENENKNEEKKNNMPKINLCLDQSNNDDYTCETFFISANVNNEDENKINKPSSINKIYSYDTKKDESIDSLNQLKFSLNIIKSEDSRNNSPIIENIYEEKKVIETNNTNNKISKMTKEELLNKFFIDIKFYRPFEIKSNPKDEIFDVTNFMNDIKNKKLEEHEDKFDYKIRISDNKKYLLKLEVFNNDGVKICIIDKNNNNNEILSSKYSFNKLLNLYKIIRHDLCLYNMQIYDNFNSYEEFISKTFLNFITINKEKENFKLKLAKKPLGLCHCNITIQIHFCKCIFDIIVMAKNYCKIIFSSENDDSNSMAIDTYFDEESFNMLIDTELIDNNKYVYSFKNNDLNNNELLMELIKKLQKCINSYCSGIVNVFDDIYPKTNANQKKLKDIYIFKLNINNKINDLKLYVCELGNRLCKVVTVDQNMVKQKGIIYSCEIADLFGYETGEIWKKLFAFQKIFFGQLILNCIFYNESNSRICINKYEIIEEFTFINELRVCNFSLIKLIENLFYIKFTIYMSIGTWEYSKIIFIKSKYNKINNIKLKNIKNKLVDELNIVKQSIIKGEDSFFSFINLD